MCLKNPQNVLFIILYVYYVFSWLIWKLRIFFFFITFVIISTPSYSTYLRFWWGFPPFLGSLLLQPHEVECAHTCLLDSHWLPIPRGIWPHQCATYDKPVDRSQVLKINYRIWNHKKIRLNKIVLLLNAPNFQYLFFLNYNQKQD